MSTEQPTEVWRVVDGFSDYEVSDLGNVRSKRPRHGECKATAWRPLRGSKYKHSGYWHVLLKGDGHSRDVLTHVLVLETFVGPRPPGMQTRHLDGNKDNNRLANVCWGTAVENAADQTRHGRRRKGEQSHLSKLSDSDVQKIRMMRWRGATAKDVAREFKLSARHVYSLWAGKSRVAPV